MSENLLTHEECACNKLLSTKWEKIIMSETKNTSVRYIKEGSLFLIAYLMPLSVLPGMIWGGATYKISHILRLTL